MKTKTSSISIVQGVLTTLILISYLLPWITVSFFDTTQSISYLEAIVQSGKLLNRISEMSSDFTMHMSAQDTKITVLIIAIYLTPILTFFNTIFQWGPKAPRVAFYLNLPPLLLCIALLSFIIKHNIDVNDILGFGFYLSMLVSILSAFAAWTSIGLNYYKTYKRYLKILTWILFILIVWMIVFKMLLFYIPMGSKVAPYIMLLSTIIEIPLFMISLLHFPFIPYAWIIVALTRKRQLAQIAAEEATPPTESQEISGKFVPIVVMIPKKKKRSKPKQIISDSLLLNTESRIKIYILYKSFFQVRMTFIFSCSRSAMIHPYLFFTFYHQ